MPTFVSSTGAAHDDRTYKGTVRQVFHVCKKHLVSEDDTQQPSSPVIVWQKRILLREIEIEGLAPELQPNTDCELDVYFHNQVRRHRRVGFCMRTVSHSLHLARCGCTHAHMPVCARGAD